MWLPLILAAAALAALAALAARLVPYVLGEATLPAVWKLWSHGRRGDGVECARRERADARGTKPDGPEECSLPAPDPPPPPPTFAPPPRSVSLVPGRRVRESVTPTSPPAPVSPRPLLRARTHPPPLSPPPHPTHTPHIPSRPPPPPPPHPSGCLSLSAPRLFPTPSIGPLSLSLPSHLGGGRPLFSARGATASAPLLSILLGRPFEVVVEGADVAIDLDPVTLEPLPLALLAWLGLTAAPPPVTAARGVERARPSRRPRRLMTTSRSRPRPWRVTGTAA